MRANSLKQIRQEIAVINNFFSAPNTFLIPTSEERFDDCAVARFIKFMHAISSVNNAMERKYI